MARKWTEEQALIYWKNRNADIIIQYVNTEEKVQIYKNNVQSRKVRELEERNEYISSRNFEPMAVDVSGHNVVTDISDSLVFWANNSSWFLCNKCKSVTRAKLQHTFRTCPKPSVLYPCSCNKNRYIVPQISDIPDCLRNLTLNDVKILRPFELDCGHYVRENHGYRVKTGMIKLTPCVTSVLEKIDLLDDEVQKAKCLSAYSYLINSDKSSYSDFVSLRQDVISNNSYLNPFDLEKTRGIECALWPNLYPFTNWCESCLSGKNSRLSGKVSFMHKVRSSILDYSLLYDLLQFQYDRWIYKVVSGAINTAIFSNCSPARALDTKTFSVTYWQWQHRYLIDAVEQFGLPDIFITLSPFEWSFPFPTWLDDIRNKTGRGPTELAAFETLHICHVLEQIVRGYITGSNSKRWTSHILSYNRMTTRANVKTYFYRFEFQNRGSPHLHLLVGLHDLSKCQYQHIRADIPNDHENVAFYVHKLQQSDKKSHCLNMQNEPSFFRMKDGKNILHLKHPATEFALNLRAYISTLTLSLKCSMDFQTTDGVGMLLRYVTSYVTKCQNRTEMDSLYSYNVKGRQAAINHLIKIKPAEPEMWMSMSSIKIAWTCSRTKRFTPSALENASENKTLIKYWQRPKTDESLTLIDWLRLMDSEKRNPQPYKNGKTLVGVKFLSVFNKHFFQYTLLHQPHRHIQGIFKPINPATPNSLKGYAVAVHYFPSLWKDDNAIKSYFSTRGNRDTYVDTIIAYVHSLNDIYTLWKMNIVSTAQLQDISPSPNVCAPLDPIQQTVKTHINESLVKRANFYNSLHSNDNDDSELTDENEYGNSVLESSQTPLSSFPISLEWQKPILVTGKPGCGKSHIVISTITELVESDISILICCPTGFLASIFETQVPDEVTCETAHSSFYYPVYPDENLTTNWSISRYDLIVIDELSMISQTIFNHVLSTLKRLLFRPVLLLCGDGSQQQPFEKNNARINTVPSPLSNSDFLKCTYHYQLTMQHRVGDMQYLKFLDHIRNWIPTQDILDEIQSGHVLSSDGSLSDETIREMYTKHSDLTILTFTKKACTWLNSVAVALLFANDEPLASVKLDDDVSENRIFEGMRVVITQNRNKEMGVVNGQIANVHKVQNQTILVTLTSGLIVPIYPVTSYNGTQKEVKYPLRYAYANTMCKAQGQTLKKAVIWFDIDNIPPGTAYVALSRVKRLQDIYFLTRLTPTFFTPVRALHDQ